MSDEHLAYTFGFLKDVILFTTLRVESTAGPTRWAMQRLKASSFLAQQNTADGYEARMAARLGEQDSKFKGSKLL